MNDSIRFDGDYGHSAFERRLSEAIRRGKLPGKFGLLQDIVGHWAFPRDEHSWLRVGKAALDSLGSLLEFRESTREVLEGDGSASMGWLQREGYTLEVGANSRALASFLRGALSGVELRERKIRSELGQVDRRLVLEFSLDDDRVAYMVDPWGGESSPQRGPAAQWYLGPYCRPADEPALRAFVRERIWARLGSDTLVFDVARPGTRHSDDMISVSAVDPAFDFAPAQEAFNDVEALALRCAAFVVGGRSRRLMFHGPPGTGKSTLARAIARQLGVRTVILAHEATCRLADATVVNILALLEPGMVVLNDVDRAGEHEALALLHGLEALVSYPLITALTANDISELDPAVLRPGRVDEIREVPEPNRHSRRVILEHYAERASLELAPELLEVILDRTDGFSPADLRELAETAQAVGVELALAELERIAAQRALYAGDRCEQFNQRQRAPRVARRRG